MIPTDLSLQVDSIVQSSQTSAAFKIDTILQNSAGYGLDQVRLILETAQAYEVRAQTQRPLVREKLRRALKKLGPAPAQSIPIEVMPEDSSLLSSVSPSSVSDSIQEINALHASATTLADQARALGETATRKAILLGLKLTALKEATPHGQWENLFASGARRVGKANVAHVQHLLEFDHTTARRYISVAANLMSQRLSSEQSAALMQLAARPETTDLSPSEASFLDEVVPEKSLRQLYLSMGIVKPTKMEQRHLDDAGDSARVPDPPKPPKRKLTLAEEAQLRKDLARKFWFGTLTPGMVDRLSILHQLNQESNNPAESQLNYLSKTDLAEVETTLRDLLKITKHLLSEK
jgi:hypothetical protein